MGGRPRLSDPAGREPESDAFHRRRARGQPAVAALDPARALAPPRRSSRGRGQHGRPRQRAGRRSRRRRPAGRRRAAGTLARRRNRTAPRGRTGRLRDTRGARLGAGEACRRRGDATGHGRDRRQTRGRPARAGRLRRLLRSHERRPAKARSQELRDHRLVPADDGDPARRRRLPRPDGNAQRQRARALARDRRAPRDRRGRQRRHAARARRGARRRGARLATRSAAVAPHRPRAHVRVVDAIARGLEHLARSQTPQGSLKREYDGPLFLLPGYVFACYAAGEEHPEERRAKLLDFLAGAQNEDGGYGLHVESRSYLFSTVLNYVALRLLGAPADDPVASSARTWIERHGGAVSIPSWGKCWLATLGLYEWEGVNPLPPELWLLPRWFPVQPRRFWCDARVIYLALSYLYGRRWRAPEKPVLGQIRSEIFAPARYEDVDWRAARDELSAGDVNTPHSRLLEVVNALLVVAERAI